jgi:pyruvate dehydrogenase E1 component alpha subunit
MDPKPAMAELLGKSTGCSGGKGGSMHYFEKEKGFLGGHAIVGSHIPLATGVAFASKYRGGDQVCLCYFGDGAINQGSFHEALNMAGMWKLPAIYYVENNLIAMGTQLERSSAVLDLTVRGGEPFNMPAYRVDANDVEKVAELTQLAIDRARAGDGPTFIEAITYRFRGHSMSDPQKYRTKEDLDKAKQRDPITLWENRLLQRGWIDESSLEQMREEVKIEVEAAIEFAENSPEPGPEDLYTDITVAPYIPQESD